MLKNMLSSIGVTVPPHIPDVLDISYFTKITTNLAYDETNPTTHGYFHRDLLIKNESKNKTVTYK